jgi:hypothetical protein
MQIRDSADFTNASKFDCVVSLCLRCCGPCPRRKSWEALQESPVTEALSPCELSRHPWVLPLLGRTVIFLNMPLVAREAVKGAQIRQATTTGRSPKKLHRFRTVMAARRLGRRLGIAHNTISSMCPKCGSQALRPHGQRLNYWQGSQVNRVCEGPRMRNLRNERSTVGRLRAWSGCTSFHYRSDAQDRNSEFRSGEAAMAWVKCGVISISCNASRYRSGSIARRPAPTIRR